MQPEEKDASGQPGGGADPGNLDRPKPRVSRLFRLLLCLALVLAAAGGGAAFLLAPAHTPGREAVALIRPGMSLPAIARELEAQGVIKSAPAFTLLARLCGGAQRAKAGEFLLSSGQSAWDILRVITTTNGIQRRVTVREGLPWWETARLYEAHGLADRERFVQAMHNATLLERHGVPAASAEGYLFPETYQLSRGKDDAAAVVEAMLKEFGRRAKALWPQGPPPPDELRRVVILASLVERETGDPAERPRIAGVFANRLRLGMRLQCDPTTIYGLGPDFDGDLKRAHLEDAQNPYNTYAHAGLPPGPICSPGLESLKAALAPEKHDFLYFVAKGDGSHEFNATLDEHNRAVNRFQRRRDPEDSRSAQPSGPVVPATVAPATKAASAKGKAAKAQAKPAAKPPTKTQAKPAAKPTAKAQAKPQPKSAATPAPKAGAQRTG
ncbi:endolytic transglycosylase MltG [Humidesulfovibrio mexicanus]|uniref:endolytic transglycosylase MltG n=1 Tax=Humidesulfovibrio mexicanus TaxID=147047 RepID=UPI001F1CA679|nr:endolytic transglycosylase MltG [Humidesulfovibrio mexicanus]